MSSTVKAMEKNQLTKQLFSCHYGVYNSVREILNKSENNFKEKCFLKW
jgi:hypothetical protein